MKILGRFLWRSIKENKVRTFLMLFSIILSSALFFVAMAMGDYVKAYFIEQMKQVTGEADIIIHPGEYSESPFINEDGTEELRESIQYIVNGFQGPGIYKSEDGEKQVIRLFGINFLQMQTLNPVKLPKEDLPISFEGNQIILGSEQAKALNVKKGDTITLEINKKPVELTVIAMAETQGLFLDVGSTIYGLVPKELMEEIYGAEGEANILFIKVKDREKIESTIEQLKNSYPNDVVREPYTEEQVQNSIGGISTAFKLVAFLALVMSFFIIYSSFKVLSFERLPVIGTYRSIGATRFASNLVLIAESALYGINGGVIGAALGVLLNRIVVEVTTPDWVLKAEGISMFDFTAFILSICVGIILSLISSIVPIVRVSRFEIKEIILGSFTKTAKNRPQKGVIGLIALAFSIIGPVVSNYHNGLVINALALIMLFVAVTLLIPYVANFIVMVLQLIFRGLNRNLGILASKNIRGNKIMINNMTLLTISLTGLLAMNMVTYSAINRIVDSYKERYYELMIEVEKADDAFEQELLTIDGIRDVYSFYESSNVEIIDKKFLIQGFQGVDIDKILDYRAIVTDEDEKVLIESLRDGRNIILSDVLKRRLNVDKGDKIQLRMKSGVQTYTIVGFIDTVLFMGNTALISNDNFVEDMLTKYYYRLYIKTDPNVKEIAKEVSVHFADREPLVYIVEELRNSDVEGYDAVFQILNAFTAITLLLGIFGVMNNLLISFMERRRSLAILRSTGMDKGQNAKMFVVEAIICGGIGSFIGAFSTIITVKIIDKILVAVNQPITVHINYQYLFGSFFAGILISVLAMLSPMIKASKMSIVESIKYE